ncbi:MAG: hypothetical protein LBH56_03980, partial [Coriobacteriales bacterium]|nr:hypothetical protein [Coriobacteriales bacterium]
MDASQETGRPTGCDYTRSALPGAQQYPTQNELFNGDKERAHLNRPSPARRWCGAARVLAVGATGLILALGLWGAPVEVAAEPNQAQPPNQAQTLNQAPNQVSNQPSNQPTNPPQQIIREYTYEVSDVAPLIDERFTDEGGTLYLLKELSDPVVVSAGSPERHFTATLRRPISPELESQGTEAVREHIGLTYDYNSEDFAGVMYLQTLSTEPVYHSVEEQVERVIVYPGLPSEDVFQLPESESFTVSSDEEKDATITQELRRVAVSWTVTAFDEDGRPLEYEATVIFRGVQRRLLVDYFIATADYAGFVPAVLQRETIFATYTATPGASNTSPATPTPAPLVTLPESTAPTAAPSPKIAPVVFFAVGGTVVVITLFALVFLLYFFVYRNVCLIGISKTGERSVLLRKRLRVTNGEATLRINPSLKLYHGNTVYLLLLKGRLAQQNGQLTVLWGDRVIARATLQREIGITTEL